MSKKVNKIITSDDLIDISKNLDGIVDDIDDNLNENPSSQIFKFFATFLIVILFGFSIISSFIFGNDTSTENVKKPIGQSQTINTSNASILCPGAIEPYDEYEGIEGAYSSMPTKPEVQNIFLGLGLNDENPIQKLGYDKNDTLGNIDIINGDFDLAVAINPDPTPSVFYSSNDPDQSKTGIAGVSISKLNDGDFKGISTANCTVPSTDTWLVANETFSQNSNILMLYNPNLTSANVALTAFGTDDPTVISKNVFSIESGLSTADVSSLQYSASKQISVPGGEFVKVPLGSGAADQDALIINVKSSGVKISAQIQSSILDGIVSLGSDYSSPTATPSNELVIPGIYKSESANSKLEILGFSDIKIDLDLINSDGTIFSKKLDLESGKVTIFDLNENELSAGKYTAVLKTDCSESSLECLIVGGAVTRNATELAYTTAIKSANSLIIPSTNFAQGTLNLYSSETENAIVISYNNEGVAVKTTEIAFDKKYIAIPISDLYDQADTLGGIQIVSLDSTEHEIYANINLSTSNGYLSTINSYSTDLITKNVNIYRLELLK
ncbi:MAG: DUF5719 family protein [Bifidobacteriaceae bacterium]|jgi:hypothetical protein|nr:DUF5719 family protein [Bifidobacteriaceae bacterium]